MWLVVQSPVAHGLVKRGQLFEATPGSQDCTESGSHCKRAYCGVANSGVVADGCGLCTAHCICFGIQRASTGRGRQLGHLGAGGAGGGGGGGGDGEENVATPAKRIRACGHPDSSKTYGAACADCDCCTRKKRCADHCTCPGGPVKTPPRKSKKRKAKNRQLGQHGLLEGDPTLYEDVGLEAGLTEPVDPRTFLEGSLGLSRDECPAVGRCTPAFVAATVEAHLDAEPGGRAVRILGEVLMAAVLKVVDVLCPNDHLGALDILLSRVTKALAGKRSRAEEQLDTMINFAAHTVKEYGMGAVESETILGAVYSLGDPSLLVRTLRPAQVEAARRQVIRKDHRAVHEAAVEAAKSVVALAEGLVLHLAPPPAPVPAPMLEPLPGAAVEAGGGGGSGAGPFEVRDDADVDEAALGSLHTIAGSGAGAVRHLRSRNARRTGAGGPQVPVEAAAAGAVPVPVPSPAPVPPGPAHVGPPGPPPGPPGAAVPQEPIPAVPAMEANAAPQPPPGDPGGVNGAPKPTFQSLSRSTRRRVRKIFQRLMSGMPLAKQPGKRRKISEAVIEALINWVFSRCNRLAWSSMRLRSDGTFQTMAAKERMETVDAMWVAYLEDKSIPGNLKVKRTTFFKVVSKVTGAQQRVRERAVLFPALMHSHHCRVGLTWLVHSFGNPARAVCHCSRSNGRRSTCPSWSWVSTTSRTSTPLWRRCLA